MMKATFPYLAGCRSSRFWLEGQSLDPQQSLNGTDTVIPSLAGRWKANAEFVIHGEDRVLQWQAFLAQMQGRIGTTRVPCFTRHRPRDRDGHMPGFARMAGLAQSQTFEHFGFEASPARRLVSAAAAPLRATEITVTRLDSTGLRPGQFFSVGDRLHQVQTSRGVAEDRQRIIFQPPLRAALPAGTVLEVDRPVCRMRFTTEEEGQFADAVDDIAPRVTITLVEAL